MTEFAPAPIPDGRTVISGKTYVTDAKGSMVPVELAKPQHLLEDETVRRIVGFGMALSGQVTRFKEHTFEDIGGYDVITLRPFSRRNTIPLSGARRATKP